jgi:enoyl-CoA hydratase/carnithine racemase
MTALLEGDLAPARFEGPVHIERNGRVGFIVIDNPPINAGSLSVRKGLVAVLIELASDPGLDAGALIGAGSTFIAGSDLKSFPRRLSTLRSPPWGCRDRGLPEADRRCDSWGRAWRGL